MEQPRINIKDKFKRTFTIRSILGFLCIVSAIVVLTMIEGMVLGLSIKACLTSTFWIRVGYRTALKWLAQTGTGLLMINYFYNINKRTLDTRERCSKLLKTKNKNFPAFIQNEDKESKIKAWKHKVNDDITRTMEKLENCKKADKKEEYRNLVKELKLKLTDEYIEENFDVLPIKYPRRLENQFMYADSMDINEDDELDVDVDKKMMQGTLKGIFGGIIWSIVITLIMASEWKQDRLAIIIGIVSDVLIVLIATVYGVLKNYRTSNVYIIGNLITKISIMYKFVRKEYNIDEEDPDVILKKIHISKESKDLGQNLAMQIQNGTIILEGDKLINKENKEVIGYKKDNNDKGEQP